MITARKPEEVEDKQIIVIYHSNPKRYRSGDVEESWTNRAKPSPGRSARAVSRKTRVIPARSHTGKPITGVKTISNL